MRSFFCYEAGKKTTDEELEEMLESGNPAIFTSGVSDSGAGAHTPPQGKEATGEFHSGGERRVDCRCREAGQVRGSAGGCVRASGGMVADGLSLCGARRSLTLRFPSKPSVRSRDGTRTS